MSHIKTMPPLGDAYFGKRILLIGGTGFLGKIILEKLLRETPDLAQIYLLIRSNRRGDTAAERIDKEIIGTPLFSNLREHVGEATFTRLANKMVGVTGDTTQQNFGLDAAFHARLAGACDLIINSAASVNFQESLDQALLTNTYSVDKLLEFARPANTPILHISTCYVNGFKKGLIAEVNHGPGRQQQAAGEPAAKASGDYHDTGELLSLLQAQIRTINDNFGDDDKARELEMVTLGQSLSNRYGWNDSYTFTKWLAEQELLKHRAHGPLTILRPSIIESTWKQPFPGWLEGIKVADAVIYAYARAKLSLFPARKNRVIDVIPADLVANSALLAGAELLTQPRAVRIYQCSSGASNPLTIEKLRDYVVTLGREQHEDFPRLFVSKPDRSLRILYPAIYYSLMRCYRAYMGFRRLLRAEGASGSRRASRFAASQKLVNIYAFYSSPDYVFCNRQLIALHQRFQADDRLRLPVDAADLDWQAYISQVHVPGLHRYALRGDKLTTTRPKTGELAQQ